MAFHITKGFMVGGFYERLIRVVKDCLRAKN